MKYVIYTGVLFMPDGNAAAQRANAFSSMIKKNGYVPVIVGMDSLCEKPIIETKKETDGVIYFSMHYPSSIKGWLKMLYDSKSIIDVIKYFGYENVQAVIAMDYFAPALKRMMDFCSNYNIRFIIDTVDWFAKSQYSFPKCVIKDIDTWLRMKILNKKTKYMITISKYLYNYYHNYVENIVYVPGVIHKDDVYDDLPRYQKQEKLTLCFVGSPGKKCDKEKIDWLIQAICKINMQKNIIKFIIVGIDKQTLIQNRPDLTSISGFDDSIICKGRLQHSECLKIISKSDFSVIVRENTLLSNAGFPTKVGESFACGTPVFVTPTSDIEEYIPEGYGVVTNDCTYESIERKLEELSQLSSENILDMHNKVIADNPLDYSRFFMRIRKVIE